MEFQRNAKTRGRINNFKFNVMILNHKFNAKF